MQRSPYESPGRMWRNRNFSTQSSDYIMEPVLSLTSKEPAVAIEKSGKKIRTSEV
jgi:hypothetical protein